jgi:tRNA 2-thiouridine synthesizing protein A
VAFRGRLPGCQSAIGVAATNLTHCGWRIASARVGRLRYGASLPYLSGMDTSQTLNLRGLKCPLPALRTRKALKALAPGTRLTVECTDPMAAIDIPNLVQQTGDQLTSQSSTGDVITFVIIKA